jgi:hypothetical protein
MERRFAVKCRSVSPWPIEADERLIVGVVL